MSGDLKEPALFLGLMSGTSVDAIDAALVSISNDGEIRLFEHHTHEWPHALRCSLRDLPSAPPPSWAEWMRLDRLVAEEHANAAMALLEMAPAPPSVVGFHGQTVFHAPDEANTLQIGSPAHLAARVGIPVVADLRRADMARGGQGAPLAPFFHAAAFNDNSATRGVLNLGGIANLSVLNGTAGVTAGFDCGPANALMDHWVQSRFGKEFDNEGRFASSGRIDQSLLQRLHEDPYFALPTPKSTGREYFSPGWLAKRLHGNEDAHDVLRTLLEFTAVSIRDAVMEYELDEIILAGGGAKNRLLVERLSDLLAPCQLRRTSEFGWPDQAIEAGLTAWLAAQHFYRNTLDGKRITGAYPASIAGAFYPS